MALQGPIPVTFEMVFPHGCYVVGEVEKVKDFEASTNLGPLRPSPGGRTAPQTAYDLTGRAA